MTDVEIIERQLAQCSDRLDRATNRIEAVTQERQALGYDLHIGEDQAKAAARTRLGQLRHELAGLAEERETLAGALAELKKRLTAAQHLVVRADDQARRARAHAILKELELLAPQLDQQREHPSEGGLYLPNDPVLQLKVGELVGRLCAELRALQLTTADFPSNWRWDVASKPDLSEALRKTVWAGWPKIGFPVERGAVKPGERRYNEVPFVKIFDAWGKAIRADLTRHERANNVEQAA